MNRRELILQGLRLTLLNLTTNTALRTRNTQYHTTWISKTAALWCDYEFSRQRVRSSPQRMRISIQAPALFYFLSRKPLA